MVNGTVWMGAVEAKNAHVELRTRVLCITLGGMKRATQLYPVDQRCATCPLWSRARASTVRILWSALLSFIVGFLFCLLLLTVYPA